MNTDLLFYYCPDLQQLAAWGSAYFVFITLLLLGYAFVRHPKLDSVGPVMGIAPLAGFGVVYLLLLFLGFAKVGWAFSTAMASVAVLVWVDAAYHWRQTLVLARNWVPVLLLMAPVTLLVAGTDVLLWDNFSHWLPAAQYVTELGHFPLIDVPAVHSNTAYPYGLALQNAAVSWLSGDFAPNANAVLNILWLATLLFWFPVMGRGGRLVWAVVFIPLMAALGAGYVASSYADPLIAITVAHLLLWGLSHVREVPRLNRIWLALALVAVVPVAIKQVGLVLLFFAGLVLLGVHLKENPVKNGRELVERGLRWVGVFAPALLADRVWLLYVRWQDIPGGFSLRGPSEWYWSWLPQTLHSAWLYVVQAPWAFAWLPLLLAVVVWQRRTTPVAALVFALLYIVFLLFTYIASFSPFEGQTAASFSRYAGHVSLLGWLAVLLPLAEVIQRRVTAQAVLRGLTWVSVLVLLLTVWNMRQVLHLTNGPAFKAWDVLAGQLSQVLPRGSSVGLVDGLGNGFVAKYVEYKMNRHARLAMMNQYGGRVTVESINKFANQTGVNYLFFYTLPPALLAQAKLPQNSWNLISINRVGPNGKEIQWDLVKQWRFKAQ